MNETRELSVGEMAARSGLAVSAIHFYESKGLIRSRRTSGNQRRFAREMLRRVSIIKAAQNLGIPLSSIGKAFEALPEGRPASASDWRRLSNVWRQEMDERILRLKRIRDQLDACIGCGCLSLKCCPLRNPGDALAKRGPGAHILEDT